MFIYVSGCLRRTQERKVTQPQASFRELQTHYHDSWSGDCLDTLLEIDLIVLEFAGRILREDANEGTHSIRASPVCISSS